MASDSASQADYRAVLSAVKTDVAAVKIDLATVKTELADFRTETRATFRSVDEHLAEIRDLIIGRHNGL